MGIVNKSLTFGSQKDRIQEYIEAQNHFTITDINVYKHYQGLFLDARGLYVLESSEDIKNLETVQKIVADMIKKGCDKYTTIVAVGGGVVGDLAGFVAAIFFRGIDWINVPTTLLAQVDSCIGGKTGVNIDVYKNMVGAMHKPVAIISDMTFLATLQDREWICGIGEVIKTSLLNKDLWEYLNNNINTFLLKDGPITKNIIKQCTSIKDNIVAADFLDRDLRQILNVGHTLGHALETLTNFEYSHGECIMEGIRLEMLAYKEVCNKEYIQNIEKLLNKIPHSKIDFDIEKLVDISVFDKKNKDNYIIMYVPKNIGEVVQKKSDKKELVKRLKHI